MFVLVFLFLAFYALSVLPLVYQYAVAVCADDCERAPPSWPPVLMIVCVSRPHGPLFSVLPPVYQYAVADPLLDDRRPHGPPP